MFTAVDQVGNGGVGQIHVLQNKRLHAAVLEILDHTNGNRSMVRRLGQVGGSTGVVVQHRLEWMEASWKQLARRCVHAVREAVWMAGRPGLLQKVLPVAMPKHGARAEWRDEMVREGRAEWAPGAWPGPRSASRGRRPSHRDWRCARRRLAHPRASQTLQRYRPDGLLMLVKQADDDPATPRAACSLFSPRHHQASGSPPGAQRSQLVPRAPSASAARPAPASAPAPSPHAARSAPPAMAGGVYSMFGAPPPRERDVSAPAASPVTAADFVLGEDAVPTGQALDLVFIMDATGSMGSYIREATRNIETICETIIQSEQLRDPKALRLALIAYRDHPPQDHSYVTRTFEFTPHVADIKSHLRTLTASGGGDGPEAVTAALAEAVKLPWRPEATKLAVLITDAPPHGIGELGDGFPRGSPDGNDPLVLARTMAGIGVSLLMVACEPALSGYQHAVDFFRGLVQITGGTCVPLTTASLLSHVIVAAAGEAMDMERLHRDIGDQVLDRLRSLSLAQSTGGSEAVEAVMLDDIARELHEKLLLRNESTKQLYIESIYRPSTESDNNITVWSMAPNLETARPHIVRVPGRRLSDKYLDTRKATTSFRTPSSPSTLTRTPPRSVERRPISSFSAYSAGPGLSAKTLASPTLSGSSSGFSPMTSIRAQRPQAFGALDEDDDAMDRIDGYNEQDEQDDEADTLAAQLPISSTPQGALEVAGTDGQKLFFGQGAISLEQTRRLAMQSAQRGRLG